MKMSILHNLREEPWGGGNQFLKALRAEWIRQGVYRESSKDADVILINSYPFGAEHLFDELWRIKKVHPEKIVLYRLDGPISTIRQKDAEIDRIIRAWNRLIADGIIFQSSWCEEKNRTGFGIYSRYQTIIHNAPDPTLFNKNQRPPQNSSKIRLIATSWSANQRKGFDLYAYLDTHIDFSKYEMTFVGNSPVSFKHIKMIKPVSSIELASILREHDIFITASKTDPCSNSLIEALSCGLPAVALNDGGHPELVQDGGELFQNTQDVIEKIDLVANNLSSYKEHLPVFNLTDVAKGYLTFAKHLLDERDAGRSAPKRAHGLGLTKIKSMILCWRIKNVWNKLIGSTS